MTDTIRRAFILAGGKGTRLRPYTVTLPKPLVPIGDMPIVEIIIRQLASKGFEHITMGVNHQADIIKAYFGDGKKWNIKIDYSLEETPLGTMGPLRLIKNLPDNILIMNGDILTDLDYNELCKLHLDQAAGFTIAATDREQAIDYGVLELSDNHRLLGFHEKPHIPYIVSMGIYCCNKSILDWIPADRPFGFDQLMHALLKTENKVYVHKHNGYWLDIGRPDDYERAVEEWPNLAAQFLRNKKSM